MVTFKHFSERVRDEVANLVAELDFDERQKSQNRVTTTSGEEVGVFIERGTSLKHLDALRSSDGTVLRIEAKPERLSIVRAPTAGDLVRAAYHLGNRHVRLQIDHDSLAYQEDYVLDDMVRQLGFSISHEVRPFEPESGAYHRSHGAAHDHGNGHGHGHGHAHDHPHIHEHPHTEDSPLIFKVRS